MDAYFRMASCLRGLHRSWLTCPCCIGGATIDLIDRGQARIGADRVPVAAGWLRANPQMGGAGHRSLSGGDRSVNAVLPEMPSSVHVDHLAGDEIAAQQKHDRLRDISRSAMSLQRQATGMTHEIALVRTRRRQNESGCHRVDGDI